MGGEQNVVRAGAAAVIQNEEGRYCLEGSAFSLYAEEIAKLENLGGTVLPILKESGLI